MGSIYDVTTTTATNFIVKAIHLPNCNSVGDQRKKNSYVCEANFYSPTTGLATRLNAIGCTVPHPLYVDRADDCIYIAMTKLTGVPGGNLDFPRAASCMHWFANLHSEYWGHDRADAAIATSGIQTQGTYWYLATRQEEFNNMPTRGWEGRLKNNAAAIDRYIKSCFPTVVHGDAKSANMVFVRKDNKGNEQEGEKMSNKQEGHKEEEASFEVQMYDFQYAGKGCCCQDLAYFFVCALGSEEAEARLLALYHQALTRQLQEKWNEQSPSLEHLKNVLEVCVADLGRWMSGWGWWGHGIESRIVKVLDDALFCAEKK
jgi:hypothetical protein